MGQNNRPIGVFDSGVGGLTVFKELSRALPAEHLIYLGDTARVPYGNKSPQSVVRFSTENLLFLQKKKVKCVVLACNTATSLALEYLQSTFCLPLAGVIDPAVEKAVSVSVKGRIGVIGTRSTIASKVYERKIFKKNKKIKVISRACPLFVPFVEEGLLKGEVLESVVKMYLADIKGRIDTLILGCTHYPLLKKVIASCLKGVYLIDSAREVAGVTRSFLTEQGLLCKAGKGKREFYVTDEPGSFSRTARLFLGNNIKNPKLVNV